jgi:hypothetical protein
MLWENGREHLPILLVLALALHLRSRYGFDGIGASEDVQELLFDSFLQAEILDLLKFGAFAGGVRLYTVHAIKPA